MSNVERSEVSSQCCNNNVNIIRKKKHLPLFNMFVTIREPLWTIFERNFKRIRIRSEASTDGFQISLAERSLPKALIALSISRSI